MQLGQRILPFIFILSHGNKNFQSTKGVCKNGCTYGYKLRRKRIIIVYALSTEDTTITLGSVEHINSFM